MREDTTKVTGLPQASSNRSFLRVLPALAAALLCGWAPDSACAEQPPGPTAVVALAGSQASRERAEEVAAALLEDLSDGDHLDPEAVRQRLEEAGASGDLERAVRLAARARRELEAFEDLEATARLLERAAEAYVALLPLLDGVHEPLRLFVDLATVALAMGDDERVEWALREAVRLDPALDLDPTELPGRLVRAAREARDAAADAPILSARRARLLAGALDAGRLIVVQPRPGPRLVAVELYSASSGERLDRWTVEGRAGIDEVRAALAPRRSPAGPEPPAGPDAGPGAGQDPDPFGARGPPPPPPPPSPWYRQWWVWTLVAVGVAAVAAGTTIGIVEAATSPDLGVEVVRRW